jgi:hypothetical protein
MGHHLTRTINKLLTNMYKLCEWDNVKLVEGNILRFENCTIKMTTPPFSYSDTYITDDNIEEKINTKKRYKKGMVIKNIDIHMLMSFADLRKHTFNTLTIVWNEEDYDKHPWCYIIEEELHMQWLLSSGRKPETVTKK